MEQPIVRGAGAAANDRRRRYQVAAAGLIVGTALSIGLFLLVRHWERNQRWAEFQDEAGNRAEALRRHLDDRLEALHSVEGLYASSKDVERDEFRAFVGMALRRHPDLQAVEWLPRVRDTDRAQWEVTARQEAEHAGLGDFAIRQPSPDNRLVPATKRREYYPVYFVEPGTAANRAALGLDHGSDAIRWNAMGKARDTSSPVATPPHSLLRLQGSGDELSGFIIYLPIYKNPPPGAGALEKSAKDLQGFAAAVFRTDRLMATALSKVRAAAIDVDLFDGTGEEPPQLVARLKSNGPIDPAVSGGSPTGWSEDFAIDRAGRRWVLRCQASDEFVAGGRYWQSWAALTAGLALTLLSTGYLHTLSRRTVQIERRVHERTLDLAQANQALASEVAQRARIEEEARKNAGRLGAQQTALVALIRDDAFQRDDPATTFRRLSELSAKTLAVERVGIWRFTDDQRVLRCIELFERGSHRHSSGQELRAWSYPTYFEVAATSKVIEAHDAQNDPRTREFTEGYLKPLGIQSMLDVPFMLFGRIAGVVCHEHVGPVRQWQPDEVNFAIAAANLVTLALEQAELRKTEEELRKSQERFELAVQGSTDGVWDWDIETNCVYYSPRWKSMLGYAEDEITDHYHEWESRLHPDDRPRALEAIQAHLAGQTPHYELEHRLRHKDGTYRWILARGLLLRDAAGRPVRMAGSQTDITERKWAEEELRISRERAKLVLDTAHDAFVAMDADGRIADWNHQAEATFGWSRAEALGRPLDELIIPPQHRADHQNGLQRFLATGVGPVLNRRIEVTALNRDGTEFPVELTIAPLRLGSSYVFNAFVHDISARKQVQRELVSAKEIAEHANRAKSEFLANMSHEIRTPMNAIIGMTELALDTELTPEQREYLETVKSSGEALLTVINDILDFSKIEAGRLDLSACDFDVRDCLGDALKALAVRAHEKNLELASRVAPDVPELLSGDCTRLRQIIINLVGNAIKFTDRGEVVVSVSLAGNGEDKERRRPGDSAATVPVIFEVRDTGIGIPADKQRVIFDPFVQADGSTTRRYGGTGLGLSITSRLVEMMGGRIAVESEPGRGSVFRFMARFAPASGVRPCPPPPRPARLEGLPVLIVDDNATNRRILMEVLTNWRMKPSAVESGAAALRSLADAHHAGEPFALVLLDAMMPEMDGFTLAERIRAHPDLPGATVMMLTSSDRPGSVARCRALGFSGYLVKPIKQSELLDAILSALQLAILAPEPPAPAPASARNLRPIHVLLAEDNVVNQRLALRVLEKHGHTVTVANNGREVLELLFDSDSVAGSHDTEGRRQEAEGRRQEAGRFDLILMDVQMPEVGGFEATARIRDWERAHGGHIPIVAMTAHAMKGDRERCLGVGMDGYVAKPVQADALFAAMAEALGMTTAAQAPAPVEVEIPLDRTALLARVGGDDDLLREIVELFLLDAPRLLNDIRQALGRGDAESVRVAAHGLKGAAANFGPNRVTENALHLEMLGRNGNMADAEAAVTALGTQLQRLSTALAGLFPNSVSA